MTKTIGTYNVAVGNLAGLRDRIAKLNRKATKLGMAPITLVEGKRSAREEDAPGRDDYGQVIITRRMIERVEITLEGQSPVLAGWAFVALLQHEDGGTIIRSVPGTPEGELKSFRDRPTECDHCQTNRRRNDTFIVRHEERKELKQVGRNCLRDFLGHENPHALASMAECLMLAAEACEAGCEEGAFGGAGGSSAFSMVTFLAYTISSIRASGWLSRGKAYEQGHTERATASLVVSELCKKGSSIVFVPRPEDADREEAERLLKLVEDHFESKKAEDLSDYEHNLRVVVLSGYVAWRASGITASLVNYARRLETDQIEAAAVARGERKHVGTIGERAVLKIRVVAINAVDTQFGTVRYVNFRDENGNKLVWKASGSIDVHTLAFLEWIRTESKSGDGTMHRAKVGETYEVAGMIEEHKVDRRDGKTPETWLKRCTIAEIGYFAQHEIDKKAAAKAKREAAKAAKKAKAAEGGEPAPAPTAGVMA